MKNKNKSKNKNKQTEISVESISGEPQNAFETLNKYGTYNIQDTANTENEFPQIAQGLSKINNPNPRQPK